MTRGPINFSLLLDHDSQQNNNSFSRENGNGDSIHACIRESVGTDDRVCRWEAGLHRVSIASRRHIDYVSPSGELAGDHGCDGKRQNDTASVGLRRSSPPRFVASGARLAEITVDIDRGWSVHDRGSNVAVGGHFRRDNSRATDPKWSERVSCITRTENAMNDLVHAARSPV